MRDNEGKKGFFTLFNNWLTRLLINLNPPAQKMAYAPVRIKHQDQLKRNI